MEEAQACSLDQRRDHSVGRNSCPDVALGISSVQHGTIQSRLLVGKDRSLQALRRQGRPQCGLVSSGEICPGVRKAGLSTDRHVLP